MIIEYPSNILILEEGGVKSSYLVSYKKNKQFEENPVHHQQLMKKPPR